MDALRRRKDDASALMQAGRWDAALVEYRQLAELEPRVPMHLHKVADLLVRLGRIKEAVDTYELVSARYAAEGDLLKAIAVSQIILQHDPNHTRSQRALAELYARRKRGVSGVTTAPARVKTESAITLLPPLPEPEAPAPRLEQLHVDYNTDIIHIDLPHLPGTDGAQREDDALPNIPLFSQLSREAFVEFARQVHVRAYSEGTPIIQEGEEGASMYAVVQGSVTVMRKGPSGERVVLAQLPEGSFFGEMALMADVPRTATVVASEESLIMEFTRQKLRDVERQYPSVTRVLERFYRERMLANLLRASPILRLLTPEQKQSVAEMFKTRSCKPGTVLLHQGQKSDALYLLLRGRCAVLVHSPDGRATTVGELREGDVFGEISLMLGTPVIATVRAMTACTVLRLTRANVDTIIQHNPELRQALIKLGTERQQNTRQKALDKPS